MNCHDLKKITDWFDQYTKQYANDQGQWHDLLKLKVEHSRRVAQDARAIAEDLGWSQAKVNAAEAMGWLHDIGRFPQYALYHTFNDATSFNHGSRAWAIVKKQGILADLSETEQAGILQGLLWHNAKDIPRSVSENPVVGPRASGFVTGKDGEAGDIGVYHRCGRTQSSRETSRSKPDRILRQAPNDLDTDTRAWVQLIRDADKLDIFHVVAREMKADGFQSMARMYPHIELDGPINPDVIRDLQQFRSSSYRRIKSLNDFLLMQLAWVYDIHYSPTFQRLVQRDVLAYLSERLPRTDPEVCELIEQAEAYVLAQTAKF